MTDTKYVIQDGTAFDVNTPPGLRTILNRLRMNHTRIKIDYSDTATLKSWNETYDTTGYVGRSTGRFKIPLLIPNKRSTGGGAILTTNILKISYSNKKEGGVIYTHSRA